MTVSSEREAFYRKHGKRVHNGPARLKYEIERDAQQIAYDKLTVTELVGSNSRMLFRKDWQAALASQPQPAGACEGLAKAAAEKTT